MRIVATLILLFACLMLATPLAAQFESDGLLPAPTSLLEAVKQSNVYRVRRLLDANQALIAERDENGETALHWAAVNGDTAIMRILILNKADVRARTRDDWTPLHWAAVKGREEAAKILIENGADVNAKTLDGWTPLHVAAYQEQKRIAEILLISGADRNAKDAKGLTPAQTLEDRTRAIINLLAPDGIQPPPPAFDTNALATLEREAAQWHTERSTLMADIAAARREIAALNALPPPPPEPPPELEQLKRQLQAATARINEVDTLLLAESSRADEAEAALTETRAALEAKCAEHIAATQATAEAESKIAEQQSRIEASEKTVAELQQRIEATRKNGASQAETERLFAEARNQATAFETQAEEFRKRVAALTAACVSHEDALAAGKAQMEQIRARAFAAENKAAEQRKQLDTAELEIKKLRALAASVEATHPEDLDRAIEEAAELEKQLQTERAANAKLKLQLEQARAAPTAPPPSPAPEATKQPPSQDAENLRRLLAVAHERIGELETQVTTAAQIKAEGDRLSQRLEALAGQNRNEIALIAAEEQLRSMRQKTGALEKALQDSYRVGQQLRKDADQLRAERAKLLARLAEAAQEHQAQPPPTQQLQAIDQAMAETKAALDQLRQQLRIASHERGLLERQVRSLGGRPVTSR